MSQCYKCNNIATHVGSVFRYFEKISENKQSELSGKQVSPVVTACDEHLDLEEIYKQNDQKTITKPPCLSTHGLSGWIEGTQFYNGYAVCAGCGERIKLK